MILYYCNNYLLTNNFKCIILVGEVDHWTWTFMTFGTWVGDYKKNRRAKTKKLRKNTFLLFRVIVICKYD